jgi:acetyltransferase-like isoleucine patch superfamily enzyme
MGRHGFHHHVKQHPAFSTIPDRGLGGVYERIHSTFDWLPLAARVGKVVLVLHGGIGDGTWIGQNCFFHGAGGLSIGKAVGIGPKVSVITSAHKDGDLELPVLHHEIEFKPVTICDGSDIGVGSIILPGVTIGEGAIVGAGSVVTRDVETYSIVAGSPARLLRMRGK